MDYLERVKSGMRLNDVPHTLRNREICLEAVRKNGKALKFVPDKLKEEHPELCLEAVRQNGKAILFAPWTTELWLEAVRNNGDLIEYLPYRPENKDIFLEALRNKGKALRHLYPGRRTKDLCLEAVKSDGEALKFVPEKSKTLEICLAAFQNNPAAIEYSPFAKEVLLEELSKPQMTALMSIEKGIGKSLGKHGPHHKRNFLQAVMNFANESDEGTNKMVEQHSIDKVLEYERSERAFLDEVAADDAGKGAIPLQSLKDRRVAADDAGKGAMKPLKDRGGRKTRKKRKTRKRR